MEFQGLEFFIESLRHLRLRFPATRFHVVLVVDLVKNIFQEQLFYWKSPTWTSDNEFKNQFKNYFHYNQLELPGMVITGAPPK